MCFAAHKKAHDHVTCKIISDKTRLVFSGFF
jgi:hypothetical protein